VVSMATVSLLSEQWVFDRCNYSLLFPLRTDKLFDGMLRFNIENIPQGNKALEKILSDYCKVFALITLRDMAQGKRLDYAYHVKLKKGKNKTDFIEELKTIDTIKGVSLMLQETTIEL